MKKLLLCLCWAAAALLAPLAAQTQARFGCLRYDSVLHAMPEYAEAQAQLHQLREKYELEASYNLKRQRDLQDELEKGLAFRREADSLLVRAAADLERPVRQKLDAAIQAVGMEYGFAAIVNLDAGACPFLHPSMTEDVTRRVWLKLYPQP